MSQKLKPTQYVGKHTSDSEMQGWWYVPGPTVLQYLHSDLVIRFGTLHEDQPLGWYKTQQEAQAAIDAYLALPKPVPADTDLQKVWKAINARIKEKNRMDRSLDWNLGFIAGLRFVLDHIEKVAGNSNDDKA